MTGAATNAAGQVIAGGAAARRSVVPGGAVVAERAEVPAVVKGTRREAVAASSGINARVTTAVTVCGPAAAHREPAAAVSNVEINETPVLRKHRRHRSCPRQCRSTFYPSRAASWAS